MSDPLPIPELREEWLLWANWISDPDRDESRSGDFVGHFEFDWTVQNHPEHAWSCILNVLGDDRAKPHLGVLAAGPLEDLLSLHGDAFIERVEAEARSNPNFAWLLGGVWRFTMTDSVWSRVQAVWDRKGWDGIPRDNV